MCARLAIAMVILSLSSARVFAAPDLSSREAADLQAGRVIVHKHTDGHLGGVGLALIKAPAWKIWQVVTDYPKYPEFMPRALSAEIMQSDAHGLMLKTVYRGRWPVPTVWSESRIEHHCENPSKLEMQWHAVRTNLRFNQGSWTLEPYRGATLVTYDSTFEFPWLPESFLSSSSQENIVKILQAVQMRLHHPRYDTHANQVAEIWRLESADSR